jgi:hypothetical protein
MRADGGDRKSQEYKKSGSAELHQAINHLTSEKAAAQAGDLVGVSARTVYKMKQIARGAPEKVEAIRNGEVSERRGEPPGGKLKALSLKKWGSHLAGRLPPIMED